MFVGLGVVAVVDFLVSRRRKRENPFLLRASFARSILNVYAHPPSSHTTQIVVPAWPIYNKYETKWLPSRPPSATEDKAKTQ